MQKKKKWIAVIALVIVVAFVAMAVSPMLMQVSLADDIATKKDELSSLSSQKSQLQNEIQAVKNDKNKQMEYKDNLQDQIAITQREIATLNGLISDYEKQSAQKQAEIDELQVKLDAQLAQFKLRVRAMYEDGNSSYLEVLLSAKSYYSLLTRMEVITSIMERDNKLIEDMNNTSKELKAAKQVIEDNLAQTEAAKSDVVAKNKELEEKNAECDAILKKLNNDEEYLTQQYLIAEKEQENVQKDIDKLVAEQEKKRQEEAAKLAALSNKPTNSGGGGYTGTSLTGTGNFTWPVPGYTSVSSEYGMRLHPTLRVNKLHTGTDVAAPSGTPIVAMDSGTVIKSVKIGSYGNYIVIDHGNGITTLYAHMSSRLVSEGESVKKGQQIGKVGCTGYATGNHLHFEVRVNGSLQNPMKYFK